VVRAVVGRLEFRLTDGSSNIYAVLTSTIAAMLDGIARKLNPPAPIDEDIYEWQVADFVAHNVKTLPQNLGEALVALENDAVLAKAMGNDYVAEYLATKKPEWIDYCRSVSDWEYKRYLTWP
jgi:glutamine synthetase